MSVSSAVSIAKRSPRALSRVTATLIGVIGFLAASSRTSGAQAPAPQANTWEMRFTSGALVATGDQRAVVKNAQVSTAQLSWLARPSLAVTGSFGWARSRDLSSINSPKLDVFTSDVGIEARSQMWFAKPSVTLRPFAGLGAGARSYNYRKLDVDATNNLAGYGAVGAELGMGRVGLRLEARDYVSGFKPLATAGKSETRNDVIITAALSFNWHRAPKN